MVTFGSHMWRREQNRGTRWARQSARACQLFSILWEKCGGAAYGACVNAESRAPENETDEVIVNIPKMSQYLSCEKTRVFVEQHAIKKN